MLMGSLGMCVESLAHVHSCTLLMGAVTTCAFLVQGLCELQLTNVMQHAQQTCTWMGCSSQCFAVCSPVWVQPELKGAARQRKHMGQAVSTAAAAAAATAGRLPLLSSHTQCAQHLGK